MAPSSSSTHSSAPAPGTARAAANGDTSSAPSPDRDQTQDALKAMMKALGEEVHVRKKARTVLGPYENAGRFIPLGVDMCINIGTVMYVGLQHDMLNDEERDHNTADPKAAEEHRRRLTAFRMIKDRLPGLKDIFDQLIGNPGALVEVIKIMQNGAASSRTEVHNRVRHGIQDWIPLDPEKALEPPINKTPLKCCRGFNHPVIARFLTPMVKIAEFDEDTDEFIKSVLEGNIKITAKSFPAFMYDESKYNADDLQAGLCRGHVLIRTARAIFTAPRTALKTSSGMKSGKSCRAQIHHITKITGRIIAFAAVQVRFALSTCESWAIRDGSFNHHKFYYRVMDLFEKDPSDPWAVETLRWWTERLLGDSDLSEDSTPEDDDDGDDDDDDMAVIQRQRMVRATQGTDGQ